MQAGGEGTASAACAEAACAEAVWVEEAERVAMPNIGTSRAGRPLLIDPAPGLFQRVLLATDGTVGCILEAYADEPIEVVKLEQFGGPCGTVHAALELGADDEVLWRRVLIQGSKTARPLLYAESMIALGRLHPSVRHGLLSTSESIGRLLIAVRAETFREILSTGTEPAGMVGAHFGVGESEEVFFRFYRIIERGRPIMAITEKFPTTWFA